MLTIKACKILIILQDVVALIIKAGLSWRFSPAEIQELTPSTATAVRGLVWALSGVRLGCLEFAGHSGVFTSHLDVFVASKLLIFIVCHYELIRFLS